MGEETVHVVVMDVIGVEVETGQLLESVPVRAFSDRIDAECEMQRLNDAECYGRFRTAGRLGSPATREEYRVEEVALG